MEGVAKHSSGESFEQGASSIDRLTTKAKEFTNTFEKFVSSNAPEKEKEAIRERAIVMVSRALRRITNATIVYGIAAGASAGILAGIGAYEGQKNYENSRYSITETRDPEGKSHYTHQDPETTEILEWLSGSAALGEHGRAAVYRALLEEATDWGEKDLPADQQISRDDTAYIDANLAHTLTNTYGPHGGPATSNQLKHYMDGYGAKLTANPELYGRVWELEKKMGNPRIRFVSQDDHDHRILMQTHNSEAWYVSEDNTLYIDATNPFEDFKQEGAHAYQFSQHPMVSTMKADRDFLTGILRSVINLKGPTASKAAEYNIPGNYEYEAHKVIEPMLEKDLKGEQPALPPILKKEGTNWHQESIE